MPFTFTLPAGLEAAVRAAAAATGTTPEELVTRAVAEKVPAATPAHPHPHPHPTETAAEDDEAFDFDEFARNVNANRGGGRLPYPPEMKGITW